MVLPLRFGLWHSKHCKRATPKTADGDQPGVLANLVRFVTSIGLQPLVAGNIKGLQDVNRTPETQRGFAEQWGQNVHMVTSFADGTKISFEQAIVANAFGLTVAKRGMIGSTWTDHIDQAMSLYDVDELVELGGVVDYVVGAQPGPGVYVFGLHNDPKQQHYLNLYKLGEWHDLGWAWWFPHVRRGRAL